MDPTCVFNFFTCFERILYKSNCIIFIFSWCGTHTKIRSKLVVIVTAGSQEITLWGPQRTPLGILRVKDNFGSSLEVFKSTVLCISLFLTCSHIKKRAVTYFKAFELHLPGLIEDRRTRRSDVNILSLQSCIRMACHESCCHRNKLAESVND